MQLWKKNFLAVYLLFQIVIYTGLLFLNDYISQNETRQWVDHARSVEQSVCYLAAGLKDETVSRMSMNLSDAAEKYSKNGILIRVEINSYITASFLPESFLEGKPIEIRRYQGEDYLIIRETRIVDGDVIQVDFAESFQELSRLQRKRMWSFCGIGLAFSAVVGMLLYWTMRRINRPVNQIAHELRTPLTGIRGYAEYLLMGNLTEEDRFFAAQQIVESAENLQDITEKLLIMGNVRDGTIRTKRIDLKKIFEKLEERYPGIETECALDFLNGDETLILCLLENLIENALGAGEHVRVSADTEGIRVWNDGEALDERTVKAINRGQEFLESRVGEHGYGIQICREIARAHGWKLKYRSAEGEGTTAVCEF